MMMDDARMEEAQILNLLIELNTHVAGIAAKLEGTEKSLNMITEMTMDHENRLTRLESDKPAQHDESAKDSSLRDMLVPLLVKGLVASILVIGSLTGAAGLIKEIFAR